MNKKPHTFPAVNVKLEMKKLRIWNKDNPKKRKTKSGVRNHISKWMAQEQNKGGQLRGVTDGYSHLREKYAKDGKLVQKTS